MKLLINLILSALAVLVAAYLLPGVHISGFFTAVVVAIVIGFVNAVIRPLVLLLTLPINILTLGLFTFVIIGGLVLMVSGLVPGFAVDGFLWALGFAFVLALVNMVLSGVKPTLSYT